jgi:hypothetical protein
VDEFELLIIERLERCEPIAQNLAIDLVDRLDWRRGSVS